MHNFQTKSLTYLQLLYNSCTASLVSGRLFPRSLGTIGFRDVAEANLAVNDREHGERKRPSN